MRGRYVLIDLAAGESCIRALVVRQDLNWLPASVGGSRINLGPYTLSLILQHTGRV
jgi:hypothetical protein